ncbi:MAG: NAD-dependent deacylase [Chloroflexota bacterium]|nr:NAD-dependent deacylase [Chloroflexota bacterium]
MEELVKRVAVELASANHIVALTGAGLSTESGIPDFRGPSGVWTRFGEPRMDGYQRLRHNPASVAKDFLRPGMIGMGKSFLLAKPNPGHFAFAELERMGLLKCLVTQNADNLHRRAGNKNVIEFHGNAYKLRCLRCHQTFGFFQWDKLAAHRIRCRGFIKTDGVLFGEPIPPDRLERSFEQASCCDCMIVAGTTALVYPAANLPRYAKSSGAKIIELNAEETHLSYSISDYFLKGKIGEILPEIVDGVAGLRGS